MQTLTRDQWVIEPRGAGLAGRLIEVWRARSLIPFFAHRSAEQIISRTALGFLWLVLRPAVPAAVMIIVFGFFANLRAGVNIPYVIFFLYGLTAWSAFEGPLTWGTRSLFRNRPLLAKIYFPRMLVPLAGVYPGLVEFAVHIGFLALALASFAIFRGEFYVAAGWGLIIAAAALALSFLLALGVSLFTSLWDYSARDTRYTLQIGLRFLLYVCPVIYPAEHIPAQYRAIYFLNPLAGIIQSFRAAMLGDLGAVPIGALLYATFFVGALLLAGMIYFFSTESDWIDRA
jgi:lipopolysaccharide transport system permease protein